MLNNWQPILVFIGTIFAFYLFRTILMVRIVQLSKKTKNDIDDLLVEILRTVNMPFAVVLAVLITVYYMGFDIVSQLWFYILVIFILTYQATKIVQLMFNYTVRKTHGENGAGSVQGLKFLISIAIWSGGFLIILSSLGYNITSIIAGLGIGGIAIALALQNILSDIFSSFSIYFDKPFIVGDYIVSETKEGTVERIGLKTTRLRSLRGEEIVLSNRELTNAAIENFGKLEKRRVLVNLQFEYGTKNSQLEKLSELVEKTISKISNTEFSRIHFKEFGDSGLIHELVYYINSGNYDVYVEAQHAINLALKDLFEKQKINLNYPTQKIIIKK